MPSDSTPTLPVAGALIDGKYRVEKVLGEGGMGIVFKATHARLGQHVAIKMLHRSMLAKPDIVERFEREARAAAQLRSRHAVRVLDVDVTADHHPYMVMEFLDGHDLAAELHARGRFGVAEAVDCVLQACAAMTEAHALGIVHRDLKPSNLFLAREGKHTDLERFARDASPELRQRVPKLDELLGEARAHVATVNVTSNVDGARVLVRRTQVGTTPIASPLQLDAGPATIEVLAEGYFEWRREIDLKGGATTVLVAQLATKATSGVLRVTSLTAGPASASTMLR